MAIQRNPRRSMGKPVIGRIVKGMIVPSSRTV
jgi:hypothetical protein